MLASALAFLTGIMMAAHLTKRPSLFILLVLGILGSVLTIKIPKVKGLWLPGLFGFFWCLFRILMLIETRFPENLLGKNVTVTGVIASIPEKQPDYLRFEFEIQRILSSDGVLTRPIKVLLSHYTHRNESTSHWEVGVPLGLTVRLKPARGFWNPGSFDVQSHLAQRSIRLTGTIVSQGKVTLNPTSFSCLSLKPLFYQIDRWRVHITQRIQLALPESPVLGLLNALIIGIRHDVSEAQWSRMRATGTNHLFAISGLHLSFVSGLIYSIIHWIWCRIPVLLLLWPARLAALVGAFFTALAYSALSGFALPVQRALIMCSVWIGANLSRRVLPQGYSFSLALFAVLIFDPLAVLTESFWLSFGAVAMIFYGAGSRLFKPRFQWNVKGLQGLWQRYGHMQWVVSLGLMPVSLLFFQQVSWISFIANLLAIPWVGFLVLPFGLVGALLSLLWPTAGKLLLVLSDKSLSLLWEWLAILASYSVLPTLFVIGNYKIFISVLLAILIGLAPKGFPGKYYLSSLGLLPLFLWKPAGPKQGEMWLTVLDVGQGLSAIVRTHRHTLIYDTGPKWSPNADAGRAVVVPFLQKSGITQIHCLIISHADNDHRGGVESLLNTQWIDPILTNEPGALHPHKATLCQRGQHWEWDGVQFEILHPSLEDTKLRGNDRSCVLRVSNSIHSILLPGDIHKRGERILLNRARDLNASLKTTLLIAPHHGSKTSSSAQFIQAIQPRYVLFPVGYRNRFHFPNVNVLQRYRDHGIIQYSTAETGTITFKFGTALQSISIEYHAEQLAFWKRVPFSNPIGLTRNQEGI